MNFRTAVKSILKKIVPSTLIANFRNNQERRRKKRFEKLSTQEIFSEIYRKNIWGDPSSSDQPFFSGGGSHDEKWVVPYIQSVQTFLQSFPVKPDVVDLGCGDFSVGQKIRKFCGHYIAADIVPELIDYNKTRYADLDVDFRVVNLVTDDIPSGDILFIRQVLQHLSNQEILKFIPKLKGLCRYLVLTEHLPETIEFEPNKDKPTGAEIRLQKNSGIVLTSHPFNFVPKNERILCEIHADNSIVRTILYEV